jgi:hypothetical protein
MRRRPRRIECRHGGDVTGALVIIETSDSGAEIFGGKRVQRGLGGHHEGRPPACDIAERAKQGCRAACDRADQVQRTVDQEDPTTLQAKGPEIRG